MGKDLRGELNKPRGKSEADDQTQQKAEEIMKKYGNKSESELLAELFKKVDKSKAEGNFDERELDKFAQSVASMLSPEQYKKMKTIIDTLKRR